MTENDKSAHLFHPHDDEELELLRLQAIGGLMVAAIAAAAAVVCFVILIAL
jgi:hypothetical protein